VKKILKTTIPLILCLLIFSYIFYKIPPKQALETLTLTKVPVFILLSILYFFWVHIFDCLTIRHFITRFCSPITHKESWLVRGVTYLLMIINYHAAQGGFAVYFKKTHKAPIAKTLGTMAFISIADLVLIITSAVIALIFTNVTYKGFDFRLFMLWLAPLVYIGYILWIIVWRNVDHPLIVKLKRFRLMRWILEHNLFLIFREARLKDYGILFLSRIPIVVGVVGGLNLAMYAFHAHIDWIKLFLYNPAIMLISTLPITPSGLGTGQFLTIEFFKNHTTSTHFAAGLITPESLLLTCSLMWFLANQIIKAIFGTICLFWTSTDLFKNTRSSS
jgi:uncharacterized membrane protein YbhN (UPF0104 family)